MGNRRKQVVYFNDREECYVMLQGIINNNLQRSVVPDKKYPDIYFLLEMR